MAGFIGLDLLRERRWPQAPADDQLLYLPSSAVLQRLAISSQALAADLYWIRAIQHYGGTRRASGGEKRYDLLYPLLDITTTLDPRFNIAYRFGAIFLAEAYPDGPGCPDLAIALLKKGLQTQPDRWQYLQDIGFVYYWSLRDYKSAAEWFKRAGDIPGAPWWVRSLAATTLIQGGDRRSSRIMWTNILQSAEIDWVKRNAELRLAQLDAMDQIDRLQLLVRRYIARTGQPPDSWSALVRQGLLPGIPVDPAGTPYVIDPRSGDVGVAATSRLFPLPTQSAAMPSPR